MSALNLKANDKQEMSLKRQTALNKKKEKNITQG